jgi:hypothetical protein
MQVLTDAFNLGYLSNRHCEWYGAPALAEILFRPLANKKISDYFSKYGLTTGKDAPSECGAWWYRFFRRSPAYVPLSEVSDLKMKAFRRSLTSFQRRMDVPIIYKNLYASLRLEPIAYYLPNSLFVVIERNWVDNSQSILKGRYDSSGDYSQWWSVPPPNVNQLSSLPPIQQVVGQIESIYALINKDIDRLGLEERTFRIRYEDLCRDVHGTLDEFQAFMAGHSVELTSRYSVPKEFSINHSTKIPEFMYLELREEVAKRKSNKAIIKGVGK